MKALDTVLAELEALQERVEDLQAEIRHRAGPTSESAPTTRSGTGHMP